MADDPNSAEGMSYAALCLTVGMYSKLRARGLLSDTDISEIVDGAVKRLGAFAASEPVVSYALGVLNGLRPEGSKPKAN